MSRAFFAICLTLPGIFTIAQVSNNNIKDRTELLLNASPVHSNTNNASVEWNCINKALTNKCLVYHNDQWFHFTPDHNGKFFLNISSQQCRDQRGIQAIVIEGNPCEIKTYKILQCISKIHQDDVFIELDSLKSGVQYLVNIDGFLGDFCDFDIQFSSKPTGLPRVMSNRDTLNMKTSLKGSVVTIQWSVDETVAEEIKNFKVFRLEKGVQKSSLIGEAPLKANALGDYSKDYMLQDSLVKPGNYLYRIFGVQKETEYPILLDQQPVSFRPSNASEEGSTWAYIPIDLKEGDPFLVLVFNRVDYSLLRKYTGEFNQAKDSTFEVNLNEFVATGVKEFIILTSEKNSRQSKEFYFMFDGTKIVKQ